LLGSIEEPQKQEQLAKMMIEQGLSRGEARVAREALEKGLLLKKPLRLLRLSSERSLRLKKRAQGFNLQGRR
jgi:hypothetical protein